MLRTLEEDRYLLVHENHHEDGARHYVCTKCLGDTLPREKKVKGGGYYRNGRSECCNAKWEVVKDEDAV